LGLVIQVDSSLYKNDTGLELWMNKYDQYDCYDINTNSPVLLLEVALAFGVIDTFDKLPRRFSDEGGVKLEVMA